MRLVQIFDNAINGYFDGGPKRRFEWTIEHYHKGRDAKGEFVRVGSWGANYFFNVSVGKTEKQTLTNAKRRLLAAAKRHNQTCMFRYEE